MAITPNYSWQMPENTDFVTDLPADFETFGDAVDATVKGIDDRVAGLEVITTQGDLIVGDASGDPSRLALGTTGQVLSSDGTTATWINAAGAQPPQLTSTGGSFWVRPLPMKPVEHKAGTAIATDATYYTPIYLPDCTLDRIAINTGSAGTPSGTSTARLGIYNNDNTTNKPSTVLLDAGTVNFTANNTTYEITISQTISAGWYWIAANRQVAGATPPRLTGFTNSTTESTYPFFFASNVTDLNAGTLTQYVGYVETGITGAFATAGSLTITGTTASLFAFLRVA